MEAVVVSLVVAGVSTALAGLSSLLAALASKRKNFIQITLGDGQRVEMSSAMTKADISRVMAVLDNMGASRPRISLADGIDDQASTSPPTSGQPSDRPGVDAHHESQPTPAESIGDVVAKIHATTGQIDELSVIVSSMSPSRYRALLEVAQTALVQDQDALDQLDPHLYETLGQFLRLARDIEVEKKGLPEVQACMKATLDEVWQSQPAQTSALDRLPRTLEFAKAISSNPTMNEVARRLIAD